VIACLLPSVLRAEEQDYDYISMKSATIRVLNKAVGKAQTITIPVGQTVKFDKLDISVRKCLGADEFMPEDYFMFVEVQKGSARIFSGWMTKSEPGGNPLQDPGSDMWLVRCD
jgi:hypothetical protein